MTALTDLGGGSAAHMVAAALPDFVVQDLDAAGLAALDAGEWDALSAAALVENPFYARPYVLAGLATLDRHRDVHALAIRDRAGRLAGLFPYRRRGKVPVPFPAARSAGNVYQFSGTPLVDRNEADAVVGAWLDAVARGHAIRLWALADFDLGSPLAQLIRTAAAARRLHVAVAGPYQRAFLTRLPGGFEAHLTQVLSKNRLKDVRRTMRRLEEAGPLTLEHADSGERLRRRLEDFLALEHAGWKGAKGTALLSNETDADFARRAFAADGFAAIDSLLLDGRPIAMKLSIGSAGTLFTPKIAYDESVRKLGPGMALEYLLIEAFYAARRPASIDAAATEAGHSALDFFNGMKDMGTLIVGAAHWQVEAYQRLHALRAALKARVKALLKRD